MRDRPLGLSLLLLTAASVAAPEPRPLTLDEVLRVAREHNRDLRAAREHLIQSGTDVERARAALLPTLNVQGKYTINEPPVVLDFGGPSADLQAASARGTQDAIMDLYAQT